MESFIFSIIHMYILFDNSTLSPSILATPFSSLNASHTCTSVLTIMKKKFYLWMAEKYKDEPNLYFPKQLDFRGRVYDRVPFLNAQGNDISRSLLQFSNGKLIKTEEDLNWLKIHGANMFGIKQDFQTKIDWVNNNLKNIYAIGRDCWAAPELWMRADKAWSFLAFCRAIYLYQQEPSSYLCQLPCHLDCTCSSIQPVSYTQLTLPTSDLV